MTLEIISNVLLFGSNESTIHMPEPMAKAFLSFHSGWRYVIIILMLLAIVYGRQSASGKRPFAGSTRKMGMFTMIAADIQLVVGLVLYFFFIAMQTNFKLGKLTDQLGAPMFRTIALDHALGMIIALILIHIGYAKAKSAVNDKDAGKKQFTYYLIAFIIIMISIPWPFLHHERGWF